MSVRTLAKVTAVCLVFAVSGTAWACGGKGSCGGDKDKKGTTAVSAQVENVCGYSCSCGSNDGKKECPKK